VAAPPGRIPRGYCLIMIAVMVPRTTATVPVGLLALFFRRLIVATPTSHSSVSAYWVKQGIAKLVPSRSKREAYNFSAIPHM
jgi:hypothetical protein